VNAGQDLTAQETALVALLRGPKMSDRQVSDRLGLSHGDAIRLFHTTRTKLGSDAARESLRDAVRRIFGKVTH
jgi:hypothetical protein